MGLQPAWGWEEGLSQLHSPGGSVSAAAITTAVSPVDISEELVIFRKASFQSGSSEDGEVLQQGLEHPINYLA